MRHNSLSARFQKIWENYPCVVAGVRTCDPALSFACVDHHDLARQAVTNVLRLGYRRPTLMLDAKIDALIDGRFSAGFYIAQRHVMSSMRVAPFYIKGRNPEEEIRFRRWSEKHRPDVILTLYNTVSAGVGNIGLRVPEDLGLVQLEWRQDHAH
jgi:LacI family transcriptional regulator